MRKKVKLINKSTVLCYIFLLIGLISSICLRAQDQKKGCNYKEIFQLFTSHRIHYPDIKIFTSENYENINSDYSCDELKKSIIDREYRRWAELKLTPREEKDGVYGSIIILYGRYIKPPYHLEKDEKNKIIYLNNIQISPRLESPSLELSDDELFSMKAMDLEIRIREIEKDLKALWKSYLQQIVINSLKSRDQAWTLKNLESLLSNIKSGGAIFDYCIYDRNNLLFDISMPYSRTLEDVPQKYWDELLNKIPIDQWPTIPTTEYRTKNPEDELDNIYNQYINKISNAEVFIFGFESETEDKFLSKKSFAKIVEILASPLNEYEKVKMIEGSLNNDLAIQIVFNLTENCLTNLKERLKNEK